MTTDEQELLDAIKAETEAERDRQAAAQAVSDAERAKDVAMMACVEARRARSKIERRMYWPEYVEVDA